MIPINLTNFKYIIGHILYDFEKKKNNMSKPKFLEIDVGYINQCIG